MSVFVALLVGLVIWEVAWAFGIKAFDAFLITLLLVLIAVTGRVLTPFVKEYIRP